MDNPVIRRLREVSDVAPSVLQVRHLETDEDVWRQLTSRGQSEVTALAAALQISKEKLVGILCSACAQDGQELGPGWLPRHAFDLAAAAVALFVLFAALFWVNAFKAQEDQVVVSAAHGLPAFHPIVPSDVAVARAKGKAGTFRTVQDVLGLYSLEGLNKDAVLTKDGLSSGDGAAVPWPGRRVILIPVASGQLPARPRFPFPAWLLFPRKEGDAPTAPLQEVYILGMKTVGGKTLVYAAIRDGDLASFSARPATDAYIARSPGP